MPPGPYLVIGMARSGHSAAKALAERGERVIVADRGEPEHDPLPTGVDVRLGDDGTAALDEAATLICSPGVPATAPVIVQARERGMHLLSELECGWRLIDIPVVAITGTNGKTTTTELLGHLLAEDGRDVAVVGNVGRPYTALAHHAADQPELVVCEVSSFQLESSELFSPEIGVLLNLGVDHLDRHGTVEAYHDQKLSLFAQQPGSAVSVTPHELGIELLPGDARRVTFGVDPAADAQITDQELLWQGARVVARHEIGLAGPHNAENAAAALAVAMSLGADPDAIRRGFRSFRGVPHRLEVVAERDNVLWVNDSKATNVAAAAVALRSFAERPVHVILGGAGKHEDYGALREPLAAYARRAYLIGAEASAIESAIDDVVAVTSSGTLEQAVSDARSQARAGDVVLLAPACASYDQFTDFEQRGQVFSDLARTWV
jgi:UDP-N-acetylmuramoylalanine--D-glutamate ligase